jgi:hypothetical protein
MKYLSILFLFVITLNINGQSVSHNDIYKIRNNFEQANNLEGTSFNKYAIVNQNDTLAILFNYKNAFLVVSTKEELPPIKAFSTTNNIDIAVNFDKTNPVSFYNLLKEDLVQFIKNKELNSQYVLKNKREWKKEYNGMLTRETKSQIGPLLPSLYGQVNCKDENNHTINVTNLYTPGNYAVGCVAITFTEVLQYFQWPRIGVGSHTYSDNYGSSLGTYTVNFESSYTNWNNIKDKYHKVASTSSERMELGKLAYNCAVAVNMDFEYNGSTSNVNRIPAAANKHFRYTAEYISKSANQFWARVDSNLLNNLPVQFPIYTASGSGHAIVCDGIKDIGQATQYYHLNMGWWGSANGWYDIQGGFNAGGYSNITGAVVDMIPVPEMAKPRIKVETNTVEVEWYYPPKITPQAYELQVKDGSNNWVTLADDLTVANYSYTYTSTDLHRFRVRAKYAGNWENDGWSNYESIDIEKEINNYYPENLKIYPTITYDNINLEYKYLQGSIVEIFNSNGVRVYTAKIAENDESGSRTINLQHLQSGIYFLKINSSAGQETHKIIKLRKD